MRSTHLIVLLLAFAAAATLHAQVNTGPEIAGQECYGGSAEDFFTDVVELPEGGFIASIYAWSIDGDLEGLSNSSGWIIRYNNTMEEEWRMFLGDLHCGIGVYSLNLNDKGNILVAGYGGSNCDGHHGGSDFGVFCISIEGELLWYKLYGSSQNDDFHTLLPTTDGGFLVGGSTRGFDGDLYMPMWNDLFYDDALIMKMDSLGEVEWVDIVGGTGDDIVLSNFLEVATDQYLTMIASSSSDFDLAESGIDDGKKYLLRIYDLDGNVIKENVISAENNLIDRQCSLLLLSDGNILLAGSGTSEAEINPTYPEHDGYEGALAIIDENLNLNNLYLYGGTGNEYFQHIIPASMGGYYCLGDSRSSNGDLSGNHGSSDLWILHVDEAFNPVWSKNLGSEGSDIFTYKAGALIEEGNMLYMFNQVSAQAGMPTGDLTCGDSSTNKVDAWLVALDLSTVGINEVITAQELQVYPNPSNGYYIVEQNQNNHVLPFVVYNAMGAVVMKGNLSTNGNTTLNLRAYPSGVYMLQVQGYKNTMLLKQ